MKVSGYHTITANTEDFAKEALKDIFKDVFSPRLDEHFELHLIEFTDIDMYTQEDVDGSSEYSVHFTIEFPHFNLEEDSESCDGFLELLKSIIDCDLGVVETDEVSLNDGFDNFFKGL